MIEQLSVEICVNGQPRVYHIGLYPDDERTEKAQRHERWYRATVLDQSAEEIYGGLFLWNFEDCGDLAPLAMIRDVISRVVGESE